MIHFFPRYTKDASDTPFGAELRRLGIPHRFFGAVLSHRYRSKLELIFVIHTRLLWFALRNAVRSLLLASPAPTVVVINSDIEALVFGLARWLFRRRVCIVFETLIFVHRPGWLGRLHHRYFASALRFVDVAICHSNLEVENSRRRFPAVATRFVFVPFGTVLTNRLELIARFGQGAELNDVVVSAGKSGRDYETLVRAAAGLPCHVRIICDFATQTANIRGSDQVEILDACYGMDYLEAMAQAKVIVIPLAVGDVSAGQMVLLQAYALEKPVIITRTPTTEDYATDGVDVLMVPLGDANALHMALNRLLSDAELRQRLGQSGARRFAECNSTEAYVQQLMRTI
jgi:glycosyltransferase involved in cell wall biosynthesis